MTLRWLLFLASVFLLYWNIFSPVTWWSAGGFLICGLGWYWLGRRKALELDGDR